MTPTEFRFNIVIRGALIWTNAVCQQFKIEIFLTFAEVLIKDGELVNIANGFIVFCTLKEVCFGRRIF